MMKKIIYAVLFLGSLSCWSQFLDGKKNLQKQEGFFDFYYAEDAGEIYLEIDALDTEFLYVHSLSTGLGSNDIGLDRGQLGEGVVVKFVRSGNKILLIQQNVKYRANTENISEKKSTEQAFGKSVLFGFQIKEQKGVSFVIDLTPFLMQDAHGVAQKLKRKKEGIYKLDKTRNSLWMENTKAFPGNVEFEAMLTFVGEPTGKKLTTVVPDPRAVTVIQHHSFVALPELGYKPRVFDPRCGSYPMSYLDYSTPVWEPIKKRFITRHRLEKKSKRSNSNLFEAVEPIVYYLDPGTPEPIRSALMEGASWWNEAFTAIGYKDAFQVKMLPEGADMMDLRYNVIQWVHRSTRGWSYGATINDPRTGEIIKGHVSLGSLRIRQDFMIAQALMNKPFAERDDNYAPMLEMALARIRQLSAHEVGHTLGFAHNFAASASDRASVMDYPHPTLSLINGEVDFTNAYAKGIGAWDKVTVAYSYGDFSDAQEEKKALANLLENAFSKGMQFISDKDSRSEAGAHATAHLWDNGRSASEELLELLELRKTAIANFTQDNIRRGEPFSVLEDVFVPLYFYHRYQTEAAIKLIGGMNYSYSVKTNIFEPSAVLSKEEQTNALLAVMKTLEAKTLLIPKEQLALFPPRAMGYDRTRESFKSKNDISFDAIGAASTAAQMTLKLLLNPKRANRLVQQKALHPNGFGFDNVLEALHATVFESQGATAYEKEVNRSIQFVALTNLMNLTVSKFSIIQVKAQANAMIAQLSSAFSKKGDDFSKQLVREIKVFREHPEKFTIPIPSKIPDGSPIGSFQCYYDSQNTK
jgi:hypothetical protein